MVDFLTTSTQHLILIMRLQHYFLSIEPSMRADPADKQSAKVTLDSLNVLNILVDETSTLASDFNGSYARDPEQ